MAEEKHLQDTITGSDDLAVLRVLLHSIRGLSLSSTTEFLVVPVDEE